MLHCPMSCLLPPSEAAALKADLSLASAGLEREDSPKGLVVPSPTGSGSKLSASHLAGPKHLDCLSWMRGIAFRDVCISRKLAPKRVSIKRIPFSLGFHYRIGKFVTLGGKSPLETQMNIWDEKEINVKPSQWHVTPWNAPCLLGTT